MKATSIEQREVDEAIVQLLTKGQYPTAANVRAVIGGRGSPPVLQRMLGEWYQNNGPALVAGEAAQRNLQAVSTEQSIRDKLKAVTAEAVATFEQEIQAREQALEARIHEQEHFEQALKDRELKLEGRESMATQQVQAADVRVREALSERDKALHQLADEKQTKAQIKAELEGMQQQLSLVMRQAENLTQQLEAAMSESRAWAQKHGLLTGQYEAAKEKEVELLEKIEKEKSTTLKISDESAAVQIQFAAFKGAVEEERRRHQEAVTKLEALQAEAKTMAENNVRLEALTAEQAKDLAEIRQAHQIAMAERETTIRALTETQKLSETNAHLDELLGKFNSWAERFHLDMMSLRNELQSNLDN